MFSLVLPSSSLRRSASSSQQNKPQTAAPYKTKACLMFSSIKGYSVIVTGGSKGIGKGIARCFCKAGANVLITGRNSADVTACAEELSALGAGHVVSFVGDVSVKADCERMAAAAIAAHGGINVLCCNAGIMPASKLSDMQESEIDSIFGTNIKGTIFAVQACTAALAASGHGRIVLTSSITGPITGFPGWSHYGASKAAQLGFMRTSALELCNKGITVNAVLPGNIVTEGLAAMGAEYIASTEACIPQHRLGSVDDIGNVCLFFASREAGYITGQALAIDGGQVLPESPQALSMMN